jgi:hypothetical protein
MRDEIPGGGKTADTIEQARQAMGIEWALWGELVEAIPPAYTEFIGLQIMELLNKSYPQGLKTCGQHAQAPLKLSTI